MRPPAYYEGRRDRSGIRIGIDADYGFAETEALCALCNVEAGFTDLVSRRATSMLSLDMLRATGLCPRCGGSKARAEQPASVC